MVRGVAKAQSQAKAQKKADAMKSHGSQLEDQKKGLKLICPACKVSNRGSEQPCGGWLPCAVVAARGAAAAHTLMCAAADARVRIARRP
jgi:hypothetical protein